MNIITYILIYFLYYNIQFIFDLKYKSYQYMFLKSTETTVNLDYFIYFNIFHFMLILIHLAEKHINMLFLEQPIKEYIYFKVFDKIKIMPKSWLEINSEKKIDLLITKTQNAYYGKYNTIFEFYGSIIRVIMNSYILYTMYNSSLIILFTYFIFYGLFYNFIILKTRDYVKKNNTNKGIIELLNKNLYLNYFNSCIGNYQTNYVKVINKNNNKINYYNLKNQIVDKFYLGTLQLFQKILMCVYMYNYINNNCINKCSLFLLPLYQTTITLVYQFEYILHNYYGIINQDFTNYKTFLEEYEKYKKSTFINKLSLFDVNYNLIYKNKNNLLINTDLYISTNDKILLQGESGIGKSSLCKVISDYFNDYITQKKILYIPQEVYLYFENRTLYNVITENDLNLYSDKIEIFNNIINNIIPFNDIINSYTNSNIHVKLEGKSFSGGQEKRIYLAKWLYYLIIHIDKYDIIIFDEPDKSLDNYTVNKMLYNLLNNKLFKSLCIIIVSHNINNSKYFNKIVDVKNINNNICLVHKQ